jgi:hypothetical protein
MKEAQQPDLVGVWQENGQLPLSYLSDDLNVNKGNQLATK